MPCGILITIVIWDGFCIIEAYRTYRTITLCDLMSCACDSEIPGRPVHVVPVAVYFGSQGKLYRDFDFNFCVSVATLYKSLKFSTFRLECLQRRWQCSGFITRSSVQPSC